MVENPDLWNQYAGYYLRTVVVGPSEVVKGFNNNLLKAHLHTLASPILQRLLSTRIQLPYAYQRFNIPSRHDNSKWRIWFSRPIRRTNVLSSHQYSPVPSRITMHWQMAAFVFLSHHGRLPCQTTRTAISVLHLTFTRWIPGNHRLEMWIFGSRIKRHETAFIGTCGWICIQIQEYSPSTRETRRKPEQILSHIRHFPVYFQLTATHCTAFGSPSRPRETTGKSHRSCSTYWTFVYRLHKECNLFIFTTGFAVVLYCIQWSSIAHCSV